jgi:flagellar basal-body rod protein FlgB
VLLQDVVNSGRIPALDSMLSFLSARLDVLADNIANADTVGYRTKILDGNDFQKALRRAIDDRDPEPGSALRFRGTRQFHQDRGGDLVFTPTVEPPQNILFHDRSDMSIETQMKDLAETAMMHQAAVELLRGQYDGLKKAITGQVM